MMRISRHSITCLILAPGLAMGIASTAVAARDVVLHHLDGTTESGELVAIDDSSVSMVTNESQRRVPLGDVARVEFSGALRVAANPSAIRVTLADGGQLFGNLRDADTAHLALHTPFADALRIPFTHLAAIRLQNEGEVEAARLYDEALTDPPAGQDTLIALGAEGPKALRGTLQSLGPQEGAFVFGGKERTFRTSRVYGVVLAKTPSGNPRAAMTVHLRSGEILAGSAAVVRDDRLAMRTSFDAEIDISIDQLADLRWTSDRVVYLGALMPDEKTTTGIVHPTWTTRRDRNVLNESILLDGKSYAKGIGVHAPATLDFPIDKKFAIFAANIGIDDAVGSGGSATFTVLGDGKTLFTSNVLTGSDTAQPIRVDVSGVTTLTLTVEPATNADIGDWADWADARVILARETP